MSLLSKLLKIVLILVLGPLIGGILLGLISVTPLLSLAFAESQAGFLIFTVLGYIITAYILTKF